MKRCLSIVLFVLFALPLAVQADELCMDGTLLFREDFGGNDPSDPRVSQTPIPGMTYNQLLDDHYGIMTFGSYLVTKTGYCNGDTSSTNLPQNRRSQWHIQDDHTYPNDYTRGYMMEIDGQGDNAVFYTTTIDGLCDGSKLTFSAYVANVMTWGQYVGRPGYYAYPRLKFVLSDPVSNAELATYDTGDIPFDSAFINDYGCWKQSSKWRLVGMNFTVPNGQNRIKLTISNNVTGNIGNDFAIDDIEIRLCLPPVTIDGDHEICANSSELLTANFTNDGTFSEPVAYKWLFSPDSLTWTELSETTNVLSIANAQQSNTGWYKVAVAGIGEIESVNCRAMSEPFKLTVKECEEELCMDGTLLFREDFGGNSPDDPDISMETVPGMDNSYHNSGNSLGSGSYTIRKEGWNNGVQWHRQDDHTYFGDKTRGYFLEVDGLGKKVPFYSKTIDGLCAGSKLTFSAYVVNVHYAGQVVYFDNHGYNYVYPRMKFVLKNPETGELLAEKSTGDIQPDWRYGTPETWQYARDNTLSADWQLIGMNFTVPEGVESIQMFIYNDVDHNGDGNDFALDDIEIRLCLPPVTITSPHEACEGEDYTFTVDFTNDGSMAEPLEYQWYFSNDSNTWAPGIGVTERDWHIPNIQQGSGWFKLAVAGAGNIDRVNCRAMSEPFKLTVEECSAKVTIVSPDSVCPNDPYTFEAVIENEDLLQAPLEYQWWYLPNQLYDNPTWNPLNGANQRELQIESFKAQHVGWYKLMVAGQGEINDETKRIESEAYYVTFKKCEPDLCLERTLLYRDDFGGNNPSDPRVGTNPVPGMAYTQLKSEAFGGMNNGLYLVTKEGYCNGDTAAFHRQHGYLPGWGSQWLLQDDHTYPNDKTRGYFVEIDGAGGNTPFYTTTIDGLCAGSKLTFSAYVVNLHFYEGIQKFFKESRTYTYPRLKFVLKNPQDGQILAQQSTGDIQPDMTKVWNIHLRESADWQLVGMEFTVPEGIESIQMHIYNDAMGSPGNDFALDDIEIHLCAPQVTIDGDHEICANSSALLTANFTNDGTFDEPLAYKWWFSLDSLTWTEQSEITNVLSIANAQQSNTGWFKLAVAGAGNIDRVNCRAMSEPFKLTVKECESPYFIVEQTLSACHEDSVQYRGKKYAAPGYYCDTVEATNAIDTIYRLTVNDNRSFKDVSLSIMSGSLIPPIGVITESGVYHFTFTNAAGCDSIVTWYVTVTERCIDQREEFYLIGPDQTYYWAGQTLVEAGEYRDTLLHQTNEECDTVVRLHLDILSVDELDWKSDCDGFDLHLSLSNPVEKVRIAFSPEARKAGLRDTILMLHAAQADLHLPQSGAHAGTYSCRVSLMNGSNTLFSAPFDFTLLYPSSVLEQAWNDVLAVLTHDFNGGYDFVAYQWYENGVPLTGETHSYLYKPLVMGGEYSALLTESDGTQRMTCPLIASGQREISLYPLIVPARQVMKCRVPEESEMLLHDALGRIVGYYRLPAGDTQIIAPGTAGVYIARIICLSDNKEHPYKLIVR